VRATLWTWSAHVVQPLHKGWEGPNWAQGGPSRTASAIPVTTIRASDHRSNSSAGCVPRWESEHYASSLAGEWRRRVMQSSGHSGAAALR
jgi:hypothetical protein